MVSHLTDTTANLAMTLKAISTATYAYKKENNQRMFQAQVLSVLQHMADNGTRLVRQIDRTVEGLYQALEGNLAQN